jgi:hypothetical protein
MKFFFTLAFLFLSFNLCLNAQNVLFQEDFETAPITSIVNTFGDSVPNGSSPCGQASRGTTADLNSSSIDFINAQNSTYFLGVNPESPCGGFYQATLASDSMDWSASDSIVFKCRYFMSTTLNWGSYGCRIIFNDGFDADTISTEFTTTNSWDSLIVGIPISLASPDVVMTITMGGGEGVALDDIQIINFPATKINEVVDKESFKVFPNPVTNNLYIESLETEIIYELSLSDISGRCIIRKTNIKDNEKWMDLSSLGSGMYILNVSSTDGSIYSYKIIKN